MVSWHHFPHIHSVFVFSLENPVNHLIICFISDRRRPSSLLFLPLLLLSCSLFCGARGTKPYESRLIDGLFGLQRRQIVVWLWDEVRGHSLEGPRQKPDHNRRLIIMHCCRAPAGTPPSLSPAGHSERSGPPTSKTWWNTSFIPSFIWVRYLHLWKKNTFRCSKDVLYVCLSMKVGTLNKIKSSV